MSSLALASGFGGAVSMALDNGKVYFTDGISTVQSVATADGTVTTIAANQERPTGMAIDDQYVYWSNNLGAAIKRAPKDGSGAPELLVSANMPTEVGVFGDYVYWVDADYTAIWRAPKTGGVATIVISSSTRMNGRFFAPTGIYYSYYLDTYQSTLYSLFGGWSMTVGRYSYFDAVGDYVAYLRWPGTMGLPYALVLLDPATGNVTSTATGSLYSSWSTANSCGLFAASSSRLQVMPLALRNSSNVQLATVLTKFNITAATSDDKNVYFFADNAIYRLPLP